MKALWTILVMGALATAGCGEKSQKPAEGSSSNPLNAPADYVGALGKSKQSAVKTVDVSSLKQAIDLFNVDNGRYPKDLEELVSKKYIPKIPDAPYGMKLEYDAAAGTVKAVKQ